eukprot:scaffold132178_cov18-Tisochrysis_lutea.AAC.1
MHTYTHIHTHRGARPTPAPGRSTSPPGTGARLTPFQSQMTTRTTPTKQEHDCCVHCIQWSTQQSRGTLYQLFRCMSGSMRTVVCSIACVDDDRVVMAAWLYQQ